LPHLERRQEDAVGTAPDERAEKRDDEEREKDREQAGEESQGSVAEKEREEELAAGHIGHIEQENEGWG
ncbi:MAG: hypothetical protein AAB853_02350, partial [Patescibacteria group bacterium]